MTFPLYYLLYGFGVYLVVWLGFAFISIYHVLRFGYRTIAIFLATLIFVAVSISILNTTYVFVRDIDWGQEVSVLDGFSGPTPDVLME